MALDSEDRTWLTGEFRALREDIGRVHARVTDSQIECQRETASNRQAFAMHAAAPCPGAHPAAPCPDVKAMRDEQKGDSVRHWTIVGVITAVIVGLWEMVKWSIGRH